MLFFLKYSNSLLFGFLTLKRRVRQNILGHSFELSKYLQDISNKRGNMILMIMLKPSIKIYAYMELKISFKHRG